MNSVLEELLCVPKPSEAQQELTWVTIRSEDLNSYSEACIQLPDNRALDLRLFPIFRAFAPLLSCLFHGADHGPQCP